MNHIEQTEYNMTTQKIGNDSYKVVFISDTHYGSVQNPQLLNDSIPRAPLPANKSRTFESATLLCIILNSDSLTLSNVGLVDFSSIVFNLVPLALPLITLIYLFYYYFLPCQYKLLKCHIPLTTM